MRFLFICFSLYLLSIGTPTYADKLPDEIMEPYRSYRAALKNGNEEQAIQYAKMAWLAAEKYLGDHKTTGDLASNYALTDKKTWDREREKAFKRAVELSKLSENPGRRIIERQIQYVEAIAAHEYMDRGMLSSQVGKGLGYIEEYNLTGSTFEGELYILRGVHKTRKGQDKSALEDIDKGITIIENSNDGLMSAYPYLGKLYRADVLRNDEQDIDAALAYQEVMQNVEGDLPAEHPYVKRAFAEWMSLRLDFDSDGTLEEAEAAGLCECWPFEAYKAKLVPIKRIPPIMPYAAERSGHANLMFDIDEDGKPTNIKVISSTEKVFEKPSIEAVEQWIYSPLSEENKDENRKDIATKITFVLSTASGRIIPERSN